MDQTNTAYFTTANTIQPSQPITFGYEIPQGTDISACAREYLPGLPSPTFFLAGEPFRQCTSSNSFIQTPQPMSSYDYGRSQANALLGGTNYVRYPVPTHPATNFAFDARPNAAAVIPVPYNFYGPFRPQVPPYIARPCNFGYNPQWFGCAAPGNYAYSRPSASSTIHYRRVPHGQYPRYYYQPSSSLVNSYSQQSNVGPDYAAPVQNNPGRATLTNVLPSSSHAIPIKTDVKTSDGIASLKSIKEKAETPLPALAAITVDEENGVFSERNRPESPTTIPQVSIEWAKQQFDVSRFRAVPTLENSKTDVAGPEETIKLKEISPCNEIAKNITLTEISTVADKPLVSPTIRKCFAKSTTPEAPAKIFNRKEFPPLSASTKLNKDKRSSANKENVILNGKRKTPQTKLEVTPRNAVGGGSSKRSSTEDLTIIESNTNCLKKIEKEPCKPGAILINSIHPFFKIKHVFNMVKGHGRVYKIVRCFDEDKRFVKYKVFFDNEEDARIAMVTLHGDNLRGYKMRVDFIVANSRDALENEVNSNWMFPEISSKLFK